MTSSNPAIQLRGLVKHYGRPGQPNAVDGIDLEIPEGELFGLLGPNGAGKTTTVGVATTRVKATGGTVLVGGVDVQRDPATAKRSIGVVTQFNTLDRSCTAYENLYFHCRFFGWGNRPSRQRAERLLADFRLSDRAATMVPELSGGMAQRLQVARAIAHRPKVLFLDEPTAGLDPQSRIALWQTLAELRDREGITVLLTTHYIEEADRLCERVAIIDHGRILVCDSPAALKRRVGAGTVVELQLEGQADGLPARLAALPGVRSAEPTQAGVRVLADDQGEGLLPRIVELASGHRLRDLSVTETTLETVFIDLTGRDLRD